MAYNPHRKKVKDNSDNWAATSTTLNSSAIHSLTLASQIFSFFPSLSTCFTFVMFFYFIWILCFFLFFISLVFVLLFLSFLLLYLFLRPLLGVGLIAGPFSANSPSKIFPFFRRRVLAYTNALSGENDQLVAQIFITLFIRVISNTRQQSNIQYLLPNGHDRARGRN